jgi:membrane-bound lytic murein transglycosylase D
LKPRARSRVGATGLWKFMYATGKIYDLNVTSYTDDRMDPLKSTIAACQYFEFLYGMFGDWNLVLAAYNSGPGNVNKAIRRSGGQRSYWAIRKNLPRETRGYVPAFIAVNYVMNYASEHNIYPLESPITFAETDTIHVSDVVTLSQISEMLEIDMELLTFLNPTYKRNIIPFIESSTQEFVLRLPTNKIGDFINNEHLVYEYKLEKEEEETITQERLVHIVRRGEFLGSIANRYNCRVSDLKSWNSMNGTSIYPGQKLVVFGSQEAANKHQAVAVAKKAPKTNPTSSDNNYIYHTIQSGDTLWDIARKYNGSSVDKIREMNRIGNAYRLKPGTKIKVATSS